MRIAALLPVFFGDGAQGEKGPFRGEGHAWEGHSASSFLFSNLLSSCPARSFLVTCLPASSVGSGQLPVARWQGTPKASSSFRMAWFSNIPGV